MTAQESRYFIIFAVKMSRVTQLRGEEDDEDQVDPVEDVLHLLALSICLHHHRHHVKANEHHDNNVEGLLSDKIKDDPLDFVLGGEGGKTEKAS